MTSVASTWHQPMTGRDPDEAHRAATPLELLFDLCFVVAVSQASLLLHEGLAHGDGLRAVLGFLFVFFAIWWPWVNFTWFSSAYDTDDVVFRVLTFVQIAGVLVVAAGIRELMTTLEHAPVVVVGYVIMRISLVLLWLRVAREDPGGRPVALRYALGIAVVQLLWVVRLAFEGPVGLGLLLVLAMFEMAIPAWAERGGRPTPFHPAHVSERYRLFTIIVLGECVLSAFTAVQAAFAEAGASVPLGAVAVGGLLLVFSLWWAYFKAPTDIDRGMRLRQTFTWGYGHYVVFASVAAVGAGLQLVADSTLHHPEAIGPIETALTVAIPAAIYMLAIGVLHHHAAFLSHAAPYVAMTVALIVAAIAAGAIGAAYSVLVMGVIATVFVGRSVVDTHRRAVLEMG